MADTFPDIGPPDWGFGEKSEDSVYEVAFGDGYRLRMPDGINWQRGVWTPTWGFLEPEVAEDAYAWLKARKKVTPFMWEHPKYGPVKVTCEEVGMTRSEYGNSTLAATFHESFNP